MGSSFVKFSKKLKTMFIPVIDKYLNVFLIFDW